MPRKRILLNWAVNSNSGWGILGLNLLSQWARDRDLMPLGGSAIDNDTVRMVDPLRLSVISDAITASNQYLEILINTRGDPVKLDATIVDPVAHGATSFRYFGKRNIARCIFENADITEFTPALERYDALLCGSNWNAEILKARTGRNAKVIFEGIDPSLFSPGPRSGLMDPTSSTCSPAERWKGARHKTWCCSRSGSSRSDTGMLSWSPHGTPLGTRSERDTEGGSMRLSISTRTVTRTSRNGQSTTASILVR